MSREGGSPSEPLVPGEISFGVKERLFINKLIIPTTTNLVKTPTFSFIELINNGVKLIKNHPNLIIVQNS